MVDRYAGEAFACYGHLRQLSPAQTRAELELFDDLVLITGTPARRSRPMGRHRLRRDRPAPVRPRVVVRAELAVAEDAIDG